MKVIKIFLGVIIFLFVSIYILLFTSVGNAVLKPLIEKKLQESTNLPIQLQTFSLGFSNIDFLINVTPSNSIILKGDYSLLSQSVALDYNVTFNNLKELVSFVKQPLNGSFYTHGVIKGDKNLLAIDGKSNIANSDTLYRVSLKKLILSNIHATIKQLNIAELLNMVGQPQYLKGLANITVNLKNIQPQQLDGKIAIKTINGIFNQAVFQKELHLKIPKTSFSLLANAVLQKDNVMYKALFDSNLAKLQTNGDITITPLLFDIAYEGKIKELALLRPLTKADIRGRFDFQGTFQGNKQKSKLLLESDVASSATNITMQLYEFKPTKLYATVKHLALEKLLYMIKQPHYGSGKIDLQANITSFDINNLNGDISSYSSIILDKDVVTKKAQLKHPLAYTKIVTKTKTHLHQRYIDTSVLSHSNLANLTVNKARYDVKLGTLESDYIITKLDLAKLYFITQKKLRSVLTVKGKVKTTPKQFYISANTTVANGTLKVVMKNQQLTCHVDNIRTKKLLWMMYYPEVLDGGMDADIVYNTLTQKGDIQAKISKAQFIKNQPFDLLEQFAHVNLYKEWFAGDITANIYKENIDAKYILESRKAAIKSKHTKINTKKGTIDAAVTIVTKKSPITVTLNGLLTRPKVGVDLQAFMQSKVGKKLEKKLQKEGQKQLDKLLKKLF